MTVHIKAKATRHETYGIWLALPCHTGCAHFVLGFDQIMRSHTVLSGCSAGGFEQRMHLSTAKALLLETPLTLLPIARLTPLSLVAPTPRGGCKGVGGRCRPCWCPKGILTCTAEGRYLLQQCVTIHLCPSSGKLPCLFCS